MTAFLLHASCEAPLSESRSSAFAVSLVRLRLPRSGLGSCRGCLRGARGSLRRWSVATMFSLWLCSSGVSLRLHVRATGPCPLFADLREFTSADKREWAVLCVGHRLPSCPHVFYVCAHKAMCEVTFPCGPRQENVPACGGPASACVTAYCFCSRDDAEPCPEGWDHLGSVHAHCYGPKYEVWLYFRVRPTNQIPASARGCVDR